MMENAGVPARLTLAKPPEPRVMGEPAESTVS